MAFTNSEQPSRRAARVWLAIALPLALAASIAPTTARAGLPPAFGKVCGSVSGAPWTYKGKTGTRYTVVGMPATACSAGMKSVFRLTKQRPRAGALGPQTLIGPNGFRCFASGLIAGARPASASGTCANNATGAHFIWSPRAK